MSKLRAVLDAMEATLEGGKEPTYGPFVELGMRSGEEPEFFEPPAGWDDADVAFFHYVRGNYCMYRLSDSYLNRGIEDFGKAFATLIASKDATRAARAFARMLRQSAYASSSLPSIFNWHAGAMFDKLDWMRANAPRRDVEELDLSLVEMLTRMTREGAFNTRDSIVRAFGLVRATLSRLFEQPLTRQRALPHATAAFWLMVEELWTDADLDEPRGWYDTGGREQLRCAAYYKACELEDGSFYRVGASPAQNERKQRDLAKHFGNLLTQYETVGDDAGRDAAIARWGRELGAAVVEAARAQAGRDANPRPSVQPEPATQSVPEPTTSTAETAAKPRKAPAKPVAKRPKEAPAKAAAKPPKAAAKPRVPAKPKTKGTGGKARR